MRSCFRSIGRDGHESGNGLRGIRNIFISALFASVSFLFFSPDIRAGEPVEIMAGEILLKFKKETAKEVKEAFQKEFELTLLRESKATGVCLYQSKVDDVLPLIEKVKKNAAIEFVEPNYVIKKNSTPNDPFYADQWHLPKISVPDAWDLFTGTTVVKVAVIDSGVNKSHPDLSSVLLSSGEWDYQDHDSNADDVNGHGTLVAGIIGAIKNNNIGISGISSTVRIVPLRTGDAEGLSNMGDNEDAIERAALNGCKIINCSFGVSVYSSSMSAAIDYADVMGALVVCSAGNGDNNGIKDGIGDNNDMLPTNYPASYTQNNILSVASTTSLDALAASSNFGSTSVDIAAPGENIYSCLGVYTAPEKLRKTIANWTFDSGSDDWTQRTITGQGFIWNSIIGGIFSISNYLGVYWPNTLAYLKSPVIDCTNFVAAELETLGTGSLAIGDSLEIYSGTSTFEQATMHFALPANIAGTNTRSISAVDQSSAGRAWYYFTSDSYYNSYFGILYAKVTGIPMYGGYNGTSFAAPVVTGVAAMLMSQNPQLTHLQVKEIILQTARKVSALNGKVVCGGIVDAAAALREAKARIVVTPAITSSTSSSGTVGSSFSYSITASGTPTSYNASSLPSGLSVNTSTGVISGTPSSAGTFTSSISGSNIAGTGSASLTIAIAKGTPTITAAPTASTITYGQTLASSTLNGGSADVAGSFAWTTPSTAPATGTTVQDVTFTPTDTANYNTVTTSVSVTVNKATPVIITTPTAALITYGQTLASSTLSGGSADVAGSFAWTTPSTAPATGTTVQDVTFTPTDTANYNTVNTTVNVVVNPAITSDLSAVTVTLGAVYSYSISASGSPTSFGAKGLPTGLKVDARTGLISGKAAKVGVFSATLQAMKKGATTATATKVFTVVQIPTFSYATRINVRRNQNVNVKPKVAGSPAPSFSVVSGSLPPGLSLNASTAAITGKPTTAGSYLFIVRGSNSAGNTDRSTTIVVK